MGIDEIFKKMKTVDLASGEKRNPTRPAVKSDMKEFPKQSAMFKHRYGPEYESEKNIASCVPDKSPLAFCPNCNADRHMRWKALNERGKTVDSWFRCAVCECDRMEIKWLRHDGQKKFKPKSEQ